MRTSSSGQNGLKDKKICKILILILILLHTK